METNCEDSPFLVDSVAEELAARVSRSALVIHPVIGTERDDEGRIRRVLHAREASVRESVMHFEVGSPPCTPESWPTLAERRETARLPTFRPPCGTSTR